jgi:hypothetical protein
VGAGTGIAVNADDVALDLTYTDARYVLAIVSTDNAIARFNGVAGQVQDSGVFINDSASATFFASGGGAIYGTAGYWETRRASTTAANGPKLELYRARHASDAYDFTVVQSGDTLGSINAYGGDGNSFAHAASIKFEVSTSPGDGDMPGRIILATSADGSETPTNAWGINHNQVLYLAAQGGVPDDTWEDGAQNYKFQMVGTDANNSIGLLRHSADANPSRVVFGKSRGAVGDYTLVADNDVIGRISAQGADGTDLSEGARISFQVDGTPGAGDIPMEIRFATKAGTDILREVFNIRQQGYFLNWGSDARHEMFRGTADAVSAALNFYKTRNADAFTHTILTSNDLIGSIGFWGSDGAAFRNAAFIRAVVDGTGVAAGSMPGRLNFSTTPSGSVTPVERFRINRWGGVSVLGDTAGYPLSGVYEGTSTPNFQIVGLSSDYAAQAISRFSADANPPRLMLTKSRAATFDSYTVVQDDDILGSIVAQGADGTDFSIAARIDFTVNGTPGANDVPGEIRFYAKPAGGTITNSFTIAPAGYIYAAGDTTALELYRGAANANAPGVTFLKTRNANAFLHTVVASGDEIGTLQFKASDGDQFITGAKITAFVDGTPGDNDMPTTLRFYVAADGEASPSRVMDITWDSNAHGTVIIVDDDTGAGAGPFLWLERQSSGSAANNDYLGEIRFRGYDSANNNTNYITLDTKIITVTDGSEVGQFEIWSTKGGTLQLSMAVGAGHNAYLYKDDGANPGQIAANHWVKLTSNNTLTSSVASQPLFDGGGGPANGALTLDTGQYFFDCLLHISSMSATSGNGEFELAGTATLSEILFSVSGMDSTTPLAAGARGGSGGNTATANAASMVTAATGTGLIAQIQGTFNVTVAGTVIPSIALVTAAAAVVNTGSYFRCWRAGDTGSASVGAWS